MDGQRFDDLARVLARGTSRRKVLKGLAGGAIGGALVSLGVMRPRAASAQECVGAGGTSCKTDSDCCQGKCSAAGVCFCASPTRPTLACRCNSNDQCSSDGSLICCTAGGSKGLCAPPNDACIPPKPPCVALGDNCGSGDTCCEGSCNQGTCNCGDPSRPQHLCPCTTGTESPCGSDTSLVCCPTSSTPGGPGICTSASVGCKPQCIALGDKCSDSDTCCEGSCNQGTCNCGNPDQPILGCPCTTGTESPCGDTTAVCCPTTSTPGGPGICTSASVGCKPTQCAEPGDKCSADSDCCQGKCSDQGICFCQDPDRPIIGCTCTTGTEHPCGDTTAVCCPTTSTPGGPGICTSASVGCQTPPSPPPPPPPPSPPSPPSPPPPPPVTSLPNTGSGSSSGASGLLTSAALIGAGAAIAGHRLRKNRAAAESETTE